jgi:hypothetical protein
MFELFTADPSLRASVYEAIIPRYEVGTKAVQQW